MRKRTFSTILFDFDGCIAHSLPIWLKSFRQTFDDLHIQITDRDIIDIAFHRWDQRPELGISDIEAFGKEIYLNFKRSLHEITLHQDFVTVIHQLKAQGVKTAIVTSSLREVLDPLLIQLNCNSHFDCTLSWEDTEHNKPHPQPLLTAMERLNATPDETMMIGDSEVDILAAQAAGITSAWYHPEANALFYPEGKFDHLKPDVTIKSFRELLKFI